MNFLLNPEAFNCDQLTDRQHEKLKRFTFKFYRLGSNQKRQTGPLHFEFIRYNGT